MPWGVRLVCFWVPGLLLFVKTNTLVVLVYATTVRFGIAKRLFGTKRLVRHFMLGTAHVPDLSEKKRRSFFALKENPLRLMLS